MGLEHQFFLLNKKEFRYEDWDLISANREVVRTCPQVTFSDELIRYIGDTLAWVPTIVPGSINRRAKVEIKAPAHRKSYGLALYGVTVIDQKGALKLKEILDGWLKIISAAPGIFQLTGDFAFENQNSNNGYSEKTELSKTEVETALSALVSMVEKVMCEDDNYILHYGV